MEAKERKFSETEASTGWKGSGKPRLEGDAMDLGTWWPLGEQLQQHDLSEEMEVSE